VLFLTAAALALSSPAMIATAAPPAIRTNLQTSTSVAGSPVADTARHQSQGTGVLRIRKECSHYVGNAGDFCTITKSNVKAIGAGSRVVYTDAADATGLDTDVILYTRHGNKAFGHVVLDFATATGTVTFLGGTGKLRNFHASAVVTNTGGVNYAWEGAYSFVRVLTSGLQGALGSTVGPDGALYVAEGVAGRISRIDPKTGHRTTFASGLPTRVAPVGGAMDVVFLHHTAYVLVSVVSPDVGGSSVDGIYRVDGPHHLTVVADIGAYSLAHPPVPAFFIPTGVQFAMLPYRGGFLVSDGHHNRVLRVSLNGAISEVITFADLVPTGLARRGERVYLTLAGPVPHLPATGKVVSFEVGDATATTVASGAPLAIDVEFGPGGRMYALSQGYFVPGGDEGSPASPNSGALERVNGDGTVTPVAPVLDRPTSMEFIGHTAYVVSLNGDVLAIDGLPGRSHH
jgi:sugar lactone lactonase YvrE